MRSRLALMVGSTSLFHGSLHASSWSGREWGERGGGRERGILDNTLTSAKGWRHRPLEFSEVGVVLSRRRCWRSMRTRFVLLVASTGLVLVGLDEKELSGRKHLGVREKLRREKEQEKQRCTESTKAIIAGKT